MVALWDTGCSLGGITTEAKLDALKDGGGDDIERVVLYDKFQPVNGISDPPVMIIGHALLRFSHGARFFKVVCSIMRGGDVGQATLLIGNRHMWQSHWGALIDFDFKKLVMRRADDGGGDLAIDIDWRINHADVRSAVDERRWRDQRKRLLYAQDSAQDELATAFRVEAERDALAQYDRKTRVLLFVVGKTRAVLLPQQTTVISCRGTKASLPAKNINLI